MTLQENTTLQRLESIQDHSGVGISLNFDGNIGILSPLWNQLKAVISSRGKYDDQMKLSLIARGNGDKSATTKTFLSDNTMEKIDTSGFLSVHYLLLLAF